MLPLQPLSWNNDSIPDSALRKALEVLGDHYPIQLGTNKPRIIARKDDQQAGVRIRATDQGYELDYDTVTSALRGIGTLLTPMGQAASRHELSNPFSTFGMMLDCSRNAVMHVTHFKQWLRSLALLGYNRVMLYTEDTYQIQGEPWFGFQRGRYTEEELKAMDAYAASLGIELIGCIQTLGHLEQILKWSVYKSIKDTNGVLLVDEPESYRLIGAMLDTISQSISSRTIHIGMDEAFGLGQGEFLKKFGHEDGFAIFNRHLKKVTDLCAERGLKPMIWSDMFFHIALKNNNWYELDEAIPEHVIEQIPRDVKLIYWDYYHETEDFYRTWIQRHRQMRCEPVMAGGVWTWFTSWYDHHQTKITMDPCIDTCIEENVNDFFLTLWGDDGGTCEFDSALAGLVYCAERAYHGSDINEDHLAERYRAICGADWDSVLAGAALTPPLPDDTCDVSTDKPSVWREDRLYTPPMLWDDPLLGLYWQRMASKGTDWEAVCAHFESVYQDLKPRTPLHSPSMEHALAIADFLRHKLAFRIAMLKAYPDGSRDQIDEAIQKGTCAIKAGETLSRTFREQWLRRNKPQGLEVLQIRMAGQVARLREASLRLDEWSRGQHQTIDELCEHVETFADGGLFYRHLATASTIL